MIDFSGEIEIIPNPKDLDVYAELARQYSFGFEYDDFFAPDLLDDEKALKERIALYQGLHRAEGADTLHGAFYDIIPFSWDVGIRKFSFYRMQQSMEIAGQLGCRGVIFHTGLQPGLVWNAKYRSHWLELMADTIGRLLEQSGNLEIYCENMFDESPQELADLAELLREKRFGVCLDVGHMMLASNKPEQWFEVLAPYIRHFHVNDNHLKLDEHLALGKGDIDWEKIFGLIERFRLGDRSLLLEVSDLDSIKESMEYLAGKGIKIGH